MKRLRIIISIMVFILSSNHLVCSQEWMYLTPEEYMSKYREFVKKDDIAKADSIMEEMLKHFPENPDALFYKAGLLFHSDEYDKAKLLLEDCIKYNPKYDKAYWYLGGIAVKQGNKSDAETYYKKAIEINEFSPARGQLAELYASQGKYELAEKENNLYFKNVKQPRQYDYIVSAYIHKNLGKYEELVDDCEKGLEVGDPRNIDLLLTLCDTYEKTGRLEKAWERYEYAYSWFPKVPEFKEGFKRVTKSFAEELKNSNDLKKLEEFEKRFKFDYNHYKDIEELKLAIEIVQERINKIKTAQ